MNQTDKDFYEFTKQNRELKPAFRTIKLPEQLNRFQFVGGQFYEGKVYSVVNSAESMMIYDTENGEVSYCGSFPADDFKWTSGCVYNGKIVMFPRSADTMLMYDVNSGSFSEIPSGFNYTCEHHYGGILTNDGIVYQPPRNSDHILRWNLNDGTCAKIKISGGSCRYCGGVIAPNGYAYFIPEVNLKVLRMNLNTEEIEPIGEPINGMAFNMTFAPDGNMYGFRNHGILRFDVESEKFSVIFNDINFGAYGTKCGINGKLYSLPGYNNNMWEFDPITQQQPQICYTADHDCDIHYAGGAADMSGNIYAIPIFDNELLVISFAHHNVNIPAEIYNTRFVDFY